MIPNKAAIFFDWNAAIETNIASTKLVNSLVVEDSSVLDFTIYPNPVKDIVLVDAVFEIASIEVFSKLGQLVLSKKTTNKLSTYKLSKRSIFLKNNRYKRKYWCSEIN